MSRTGFWVSFKFRTILQLLLRQRSCSGDISPGHGAGFASDKLGNGYRMNKETIQLFSTNSKTQTKLDSGNYQYSRVNRDKGKFQSPAPATPKLFFPWWAKWVWGSILTFSLPLMWKQDWGKLRRIEGEAEMVVEEVETVVEVVEKVASVAEKISAEVADKLPAKSKLKEAALFVEHVSEEAVRDAQLTEDFIHKVDALKEDLDALVEPIIVQIAKQNNLKQSNESNRI
ncbi:uncharacterized protein LOC133882674 [Alnus glutinosa]|uniref:uncharacterized protein LOC133882674 n=1 Tax=Alnus glutinosa TaxID=3517 RepID=UPI002D76DCCC|nr:uncharacterized protein LOC133882674 [Alnus glutinosa]